MICARSDINGNNGNSVLFRIRKLSNSLSKDTFLHNNTFIQRKIISYSPTQKQYFIPTGVMSELPIYNASFGQFLAHSKQRIHSVPFFRFLELSVTSTSIGHTFLHFPQDIHLLLSHLIRNSEK